MKIPRSVFVLAAAGLLVVVVVFLSLKSSGEAPVIPTAFVKSGPFEVSVNAVGELDSERAVTVSSEIQEEAKIVYLIEDGTQVKAGDILVRLDPGPFEQKVTALRSKVNQWNSIIAAQQQTLEFEKIQAEREFRNAGFDNQVAVLELQKLEKGDGPAELSRLETLMLEEGKKFEELNGYIKDLEDLETKGYSNPLEVEQARDRLQKQEKSFESAKQQYESYQKYVFPTMVKTARAKVERTQMLIEQTQKASGFKIGRAIAELEQSKQEFLDLKEQFNDAETELAGTTITAPQPGLVVLKETYRSGELRKPRIGDEVIQNQPILFLPDISSMMVKVRVREVDLHKIDVGKKASIAIDAYPDLTFTGGVTFIGVLAEYRDEIRGGEKYFKVNVSLNESDDRLRPGMTARVRILAQEMQPDVLAVPIHAVFQQEGQSFCFVVRAGGIDRQEVRIGLQNEDAVQVTEGLRPGDRICLSRPPAQLVRRTSRLKAPAQPSSET